MMKKHGYEDSSEAMKAGQMSVESGIRDCFFEELMGDYMYYYDELLEEGLQKSAWERNLKRMAKTYENQKWICVHKKPVTENFL